MARAQRVAGIVAPVLAALVLVRSHSDLVDGPVVGIDLGTTFSCVGIFRHGQVEIVPNDQGNRITPSVVAFSDAGQLVGEAAKQQAESQPSQTYFDVKRIIGRSFNDPDLRKDLDALPFKVLDVGSKPKLVATVNGVEKQFDPEQISAAILSKLRSTAEQYLGTEVRHAVLTVPASFNTAQREATQDAAILAGLRTLRIVTEPTAAAVAFGFDKGPSRTILVYDFGGGTFDVSILKAEEGTFEVLATRGDTRLGGEDVNNNIVAFFTKAFEKKHSAKLRAAPAVQHKLNQEAERVKRLLTSTPQVRFNIEGLQDGLSLSGTLTRARFEEMNADLFKRTLTHVHGVLQDAAIKKTDVDDVVLVGGSTRIPKVQQLVKEYFDGKEFARGINPDEAVAFGAAIQGAALSRTDAEFGGAAGALLHDVLPLTVGIETVGGIMTELIPRNTPLPARNSSIFTTHRNNQPALDIQVFEGERLLTKNNHFLGNFRLEGIAPAPRGQPQIEVVFEIDENGALTVSAEDRGSGRSQSLVVHHEGGRSKLDRIEAMVREAEEFAEEDRLARERANARTALESLLLSIRPLAAGDIEGPSEEERSQLTHVLLDGKDFLASRHDATTDEIREKLTELQRVCVEIAAQYGVAVGSDVGGHLVGMPRVAAPDAPVEDDMEGHDEL